MCIRDSMFVMYRHTNSAAPAEDPLKMTPHSDVSDLELGADVLRERDRAYSVNPGEEHPIVLRDLRKEFPSQDRNPKKVAVANMSLAVGRGECFG